MTVGSIMTHGVFSVRMDDTVGTIRKILKRVQCRHLLVVDGTKLVGIVSDRDVLRIMSPFLGTLSETARDLSLLNRKVHQIMTRKPITVDKNTSIESAMRLLVEKNISCLPVISSDGEIEGIVTWRDALKACLEKRGKERAVQPRDATTA